MFDWGTIWNGVPECPPIFDFAESEILKVGHHYLAQDDPSQGRVVAPINNLRRLAITELNAWQEPSSP
jgi:hypothetical protein